MKRIHIIAVLAMLCVLFIGCQGMPRSGGDSPGTAGGSSTGVQGQGAQTVGGDQGQAETPQTNTSGTASNQFKFASEGVDPGIGMELIGIAKEKDWSPDQLSGIFKSMNGAPETVTISITGAISATTGANENVGSSGGTGGGSAARDVTNPDND